ncbi:hypothetical protein P154DRAFT_570193 [Amniculicola lignicola CBS 123094]|uniref:Uncharacterized protein n=1 Tax=Amniculicola lignicola CBS 123094 TaxID=1392246 RepID=A0A6A5WZA8_9PLEO|nr:hypothetical protein P154DRAFT_570193 [Amniculicola lignicola CBS 123094]
MRYNLRRGSSESEIPDEISTSPPSANGAEPETEPSSPPAEAPAQAPAPVPVPLPAPPVLQCDDSPHCAGGGPCNQTAAFVLCQPPIGVINPLSIQGNQHTANFPLTCNTCQLHEEIVKQTEANSPYAIWAGAVAVGTNANHFRTQMCRNCIHREVRLYWTRVNGTGPTQNPPQPTAAHVANWPTPPVGAPMAAPLQDLCICVAMHVTPYGPNGSGNCHGCRDAVWTLATDAKEAITDILRNSTANSIKGDRRRHQGRDRKTISDLNRWRREQRGIGMLCPCGNEPEPAALQVANEYATICIKCMGVRIDPARLPARLQRNAMRDLRTRGLKTHVHKKKIDPAYRVNMERAWLEFDPFIGGGEGPGEM